MKAESVITTSNVLSGTRHLCTTFICIVYVQHYLFYFMFAAHDRKVAITADWSRFQNANRTKSSKILKKHIVPIFKRNGRSYKIGSNRKPISSLATNPKVGDSDAGVRISIVFV